MFLYQLPNKHTLLNFFNKKNIGPKQWHAVQKLFSIRSQILDQIREELKIPDMVWLLFHNDLYYIHLHNELTVLQKPNEQKIHDQQELTNLLSIAQIIGEELSINTNAMSIHSIDNFLKKYKNNSSNEWYYKNVMGVAYYTFHDFTQKKPPIIGLNITLIDSMKNSRNQGLEFQIISHEISHHILGHNLINDITISLTDFYKKNKKSNKEYVDFLLQKLRYHFEKEATELPLIISKKIFDEISNYESHRINRHKIPSFNWPDVREIKKEVWD